MNWDPWHDGASHSGLFSLPSERDKVSSVTPNQERLPGPATRRACVSGLTSLVRGVICHALSQLRLERRDSELLRLTDGKR